MTDTYMIVHWHKRPFKTISLLREPFGRRTVTLYHRTNIYRLYLNFTFKEIIIAKDKP